MRLSKYLVGTLACALMAACSNEENIENGSGGEVTTSYLAVNILNADGQGSRALPSGYEEGTDPENAIEKIRFYLFNSDGSAYTLADGNSYVTSTYTEDESTDNTTETVEEVGKAVLVIDQSTATPPASIIAIANPPSGLANTYSLTGLGNVLENYATTGAEKTFIMSNSVYNNGATLGEVSVSGHVTNDKDEALANPVDIYIERVVAKVSVSDGRESPTYNGAYLVDESNNIYAVINGWQVADYNQNSYLVKHISSSWTDESLGITTWSTNDYHRSFWATSVPFDDTHVAGNYTWNNADIALGQSVYTQENTPTSAITDNANNSLTKILVTATLRTKGEGNDPSTWTATPIYRLYGAPYASEEAILNEIASRFAGTYYTRSGSDPDYTYTNLSSTDLELKTAKDLNDNSISSYAVVAQLKSGVTVYGAAPDRTESTSACNTALKEIEAQVWNEGKTYYYTTIEHLGSDNSIGKYGVVRNHSYKIEIDNIQGFGTPVYDPTEEIDPVTPTTEYSYIAARVNILSWRIVNNDDVVLGQ